ncbi:MAG: hypothetical protein OEW27_15500, partial [Aquincola sp.]|nr:hypothetical protein [Aquincola sp.]
MNHLTRFTVLIERRIAPRILLMSLLLLLGAALFGGQRVAAAPGKGNGSGQANKVARELQDALGAPTAPKARWVRDVKGQRHVQVVIHSNDSDDEMTNLRAAVAAAGGSAHVRMPGLRMLTATVPASQVAALAAR